MLVLKFLRNIITMCFVVPAAVLLFLVFLVLKLTTSIGFGHGAMRKVNAIMEKFAPVRITEVLVYQYPVPDRFKALGHIRFTAIRTANAKKQQLDPELQHAAMYMARVNLMGRLDLKRVNNETIRQLNAQLELRRMKANEVFVFPENEVSKFSHVIKLN